MPKDVAGQRRGIKRRYGNTDCQRVEPNPQTGCGKQIRTWWQYASGSCNFCFVRQHQEETRNQ